MSEATAVGEPIFLTLDEVLQIHDHQITAYGGENGIRDLDLIESAIAQPRQAFGGVLLHSDVASMAAAYFYHLIANHGFVDGNKRTGVHASLVFLGLNGIDIEWQADEVEELAMSVAEHTSEKSVVEAFFRRLLAN